MAKKPEPKMEVRTWEERMAKAAVVASKAENKTIERPQFTFNGPTVSFGGAPLANGAAIIVLDNIHTNLYYPGAYDSKNPVPPDCYAFARDVVQDDGSVEIVGIDTWDGRTEMAPHKDVKDRFHPDCATCPNNQFGSKGDGKACQNARRVAAIPAGSLIPEGKNDVKFQPFTNPDQIENAQLGYAKVPTTSVKSFGKFVKDTADVLERPLWGIFSLMDGAPNPKGGQPQFVVQFDQLGIIPNNLMEAVVNRVDEAVKDIAWAFAPVNPEAQKALAARKQAAKGKRKYT